MYTYIYNYICICICIYITTFYPSESHHTMLRHIGLCRVVLLLRLLHVLCEMMRSGTLLMRQKGRFVRNARDNTMSHLTADAGCLYTSCAKRPM